MNASIAQSRRRRSSSRSEISLDGRDRANSRDHIVKSGDQVVTTPCRERVPLQAIAQTILFEDEMGNCNLAVLAGFSNPYKCHVLQYSQGDVEKAKEMLNNFNVIFERVEQMSLE